MLDIKDVKKGNLVECISSNSRYFTKGDVYEISMNGLNKFGNVGILKDDSGLENGWHQSNFKLHEPAQDLRELLKVGYKVVDKGGFTHILNKNKAECSIEMLSVYLEYYLGINEIYKPCECGNDWILVWKREEELFELQCPLTKSYLYKNQLNEWEWEIVGSKLTKKEIDNLPNQELIKVLVQKPVKQHGM